MKPEEFIKEMSNQFTIIINGFNSYGKTYPNEEVVRKMIQNLLISWEAEVIAIEEVKNLETLTLDELIGFQLTHERNSTKGDTSSLIVINGRRRGLVKKHKAYVATWSDEDSSYDEDQEVANLCLMAINDSKVASNSFISNSYSFDELQIAYDELGLEFETMISKYKKTISKLKDENSSLSKANHELESKIHDM
ncbi:hypothetical protein J1N35_004861 [Gossypium stocksii]|uniref:Uncharacterized protein n=1 Tax=Gossypium stocksii TaxID=47602 RepID=A0A9D4AIQ1_9ROSI|nr:hypothetical protein J1N35_004861 [Gossypium stocksii]